MARELFQKAHYPPSLVEKGENAAACGKLIEMDGQTLAEQAMAASFFLGTQSINGIEQLNGSKSSENSRELSDAPGINYSH